MVKIFIFMIAGIFAFASDSMANRLVEVLTASNRVIEVVIETGPHTDGNDSKPINMTPSAWKVDDLPPVKIHRRSVPWDSVT